MIPDPLEPRLDRLRQEYVLVQAWKKTAPYIRYHNWFSDTLALDKASVNLPTFLGQIRERLQTPGSWRNEPLRIVLAPKSQNWIIRNGSWNPEKWKKTPARLRPLAHVDLADQVVATAIMLCLADRVETIQGDPRWSVHDPELRKKVVSYGNRLFCDANDGGLHHRWGSSKFYRAYYQDYRTFLSRPLVAAKSVLKTPGKRVHVVHADLRNFYDRVRPGLLNSAIDRVRRDDDDPEFFSLAASVLKWDWHPRDKSDVRMYAKQTGIKDFTQVALPQGLVASGFLANVVLLSFDEALRATIGKKIPPGILLEDACRYVDDLRILVDQGSDDSSIDIEKSVIDWLRQVLNEKAPSLELSDEKTQVVALDNDEPPLLRQSARMNRIRSAVSGGFDALGGEEILDAIQGLMRAQETLSGGSDSGWRLSPVPDVRDETVARFGAIRYRTTFRSLRPLLEDKDAPDESDIGADTSGADERLRVMRTRRELDKDTRVFALGLIRRWIDDPSNIRLLRIGLDLWPDVKILNEVLSLLRPFTEKGDRRTAPKRVAWYCLAEVLRAGATETGFVVDPESLPSEIDLEAYREELGKEACRLVTLPGQTIPWYLRQQALLFLATFSPAKAPIAHMGVPETRHYRELILFLRDERSRLRSPDFATLAVVVRRAFLNQERAVDLMQPGLDSSRMQQIAVRDPAFLLEFIDIGGNARLFDGLPASVREDLCTTPDTSDDGYVTLVGAVRSEHPTGSLRNELSILHFAKKFLEQWEKQETPLEVITPAQVRLKLVEQSEITDVEDLCIKPSRADPSGSLYMPPSWCEAGERWRFQLGFLLRFILSGHPDFTRPVRLASRKESESAYRPVESHWYQRLYGLYSGQSAFGDDWLPITKWVEGFLLTLLRWPGCRVPNEFGRVDQDIKRAKSQIRERIDCLEKRRGKATHALILPLLAKRPTAKDADRPLRACVVQTVIPTVCDIHRNYPDLELNRPAIRRKHRNHLSAALAAVERALALRETHKGREGRLDWLILPELAVHPDDVRTHLVPFARTHKAMILAGLTYEKLWEGQPLVNSALWVIPEWSADHGLQITIRRQGKEHLAPMEEKANKCDAKILRGFRPCQWLIGYPWSKTHDARPVWLTAAVCYDATDLGLASDLRNWSDVLAIPALNKDVRTFDQMALALHYHMFQLVVVANNGEYGGSNAFWPKKQHGKRIFRIHNEQTQASIAFFEIDDIGAFLERDEATGADDWKHPPAGLNRTSTEDPA